jgi:hypothetical protein
MALASVSVKMTVGVDGAIDSAEPLLLGVLAWYQMLAIASDICGLLSCRRHPPCSPGHGQAQGQRSHIAGDAVKALLFTARCSALLMLVVYVVHSRDAVTFRHGTKLPLAVAVSGVVVRSLQKASAVFYWS